MGPALRALVKVNLTLHVGGVRADGFHPISSVCAFPDIGDDMSLGERSAAFCLSIGGPEAGALSGLPVANNLVLRAATMLAAQTPLVPRRLHLEKCVPAAAGIAGGTADAAATLVLLNREAARPLSDGALIALSRGLGADGPVCTAARLAGGGLWLATGDGDRVTRLAGPPPAWMVVGNDGVPVPTGPVFALFDKAGQGGQLNQPGADPRTLRGLAKLMEDGRNDLCRPAKALAPGIGCLEADLRKRPGCRAARMSGSGGSVFGLFASASSAERAAAAMRARGVWSAWGRVRR